MSCCYCAAAKVSPERGVFNMGCAACCARLYKSGDYYGNDEKDLVLSNIRKLGLLHFICSKKNAPDLWQILKEIKILDDQQENLFP